MERLQGGHSGFKSRFGSPAEEAALMAFDRFAQTWDDKYPQISKSSRTHWENLNTFLLIQQIHKAIYTTDAMSH